MILIADSGSTKTDWRILQNNTVVGQIQTVGFNPYYQDTDSIANELKQTLLPYCQDDIHEVYFYGTGVTSTEKADIIEKALRQVFERLWSVNIQSDVVGAAKAACGHHKGIACILGTGSNSCYFDGEKIAFQVPPLGFWLGDEGSGGHLGKSLVLSYLHKEIPIDLRQLFEEKYGVMDRLTILDNAYQKPFPNRYFASFSRFLHENLQHQFCHNLVANCFTQFFDKYILKYPMCSEAALNFVGSVGFYYENILREVASSKNLMVGNVLGAPINGLVKYHSHHI
ncbi:N-acetylglucosamine kinase [Emticicia sp. 17c]|uniref:N-acetylglucosamine kinase n=1 Tax=Emticicia sp. 17c TaxID=3127704 RepID=UPI00301C8A47